MISVKEINTKDTYQIRREVLRKNMNLPFEFTGDFDQETFHLGLFFNDELASIVSFMKSNNKVFKEEQYQLRGMATKEKFQGRGFGKILIKKSEELLINKNIKIVWCNARVIALNFYKKIGFKVIGEPFDITQIGEHFVMFKRLEENEG